MGTLYKPSIEFFKMCLDAFGKHGDKYDVIISIGKGTNIDHFGPFPEHIFIRNYVPQLDVLQRAKIFVSHGGMGGINESMFYEVPMLILPKTIEQQINARRMEELGAGIDLKTQEVSPELLLAGVSKLLSSPNYKKAAGLISKSFKESTNGLERALYFVQTLKYKAVNEESESTPVVESYFG